MTKPPRMSDAEIKAEAGRHVADYRATIAALRTPTEAMLIAAREWSRRKYGQPIGSADATGCWQAMIDAALGVDETKGAEEGP